MENSTAVFHGPPRLYSLAAPQKSTENVSVPRKSVLFLGYIIVFDSLRQPRSWVSQMGQNVLWCSVKRTANSWMFGRCFSGYVVYVKIDRTGPQKAHFPVRPSRYSYATVGISLQIYHPPCLFRCRNTELLLSKGSNIAVLKKL